MNIIIIIIIQTHQWERRKQIFLAAARHLNPAK
jgi:hypothetical protein